MLFAPFAIFLKVCFEEANILFVLMDNQIFCLKGKQTTTGDQIPYYELEVIPRSFPYLFPVQESAVYSGGNSEVLSKLIGAKGRWTNYRISLSS